MKLYQILNQVELDEFLKTQRFSISALSIIEIMDKDNDLFGDFIVIPGYKFKKVYSEFQCMETPTEKHIKKTINAKKAPNDHYRR